MEMEGQISEEMGKEGQILEVIMEEMEDPILEETVEDLATEMDALEDLDEDKKDINVDK